MTSPSLTQSLSDGGQASYSRSHSCLLSQLFSGVVPDLSLSRPHRSLCFLHPHFATQRISNLQILEKCVPKLKTNDDGLPGYDGVGVFNVDGETCVATIPGAFVS